MGKHRNRRRKQGFPNNPNSEGLGDEGLQDDSSKPIKQDSSSEPSKNRTYAEALTSSQDKPESDPLKTVIGKGKPEKKVVLTEETYYTFFRHDLNVELQIIEDLKAKLVSGGNSVKHMEIDKEITRRTKDSIRLRKKSVQNIFDYRNGKHYDKNKITVDLHGQQVDQALKVVKDYLSFGSHFGGVTELDLITGYGSRHHGLPRIKPSVIDLLKRENIIPEEVNQGRLGITLERWKTYSFMNLDSDD